MRFTKPIVGDKYDHPTGQFEVDWVYGCGDGATCVGLCGDRMTWTGTVGQMECEGFKRHNREIYVNDQAQKGEKRNEDA